MCAFHRSVVLFLILISPALGEDCQTCKELINEFVSGIEDTASDSYRGGNTLWEEKNLVNYAVSETRFHTILDTMCRKSSGSLFHCHKVLEAIEPFLDVWWNEVFKVDSNRTAELEGRICIKEAQFCCPENHYGKSCSLCPPCQPFGGECDGNGTRSGKGTCVCKTGYSGVFCDSCDTETHYLYNVSDKGIISCKPCHESCTGGCRGSEASDCNGCANGWLPTTSEDGLTVCTDVNECERNPCSKAEYCVNVAGSYKCQRCTDACDGCTGPTAGECLKCSPGFIQSDGECIDENECESSSPPCQNPGEVCRNTKGGYRCECKQGWSRIRGTCTPNDAAGKFQKKSGSRSKTLQGDAKIIWTVAFTKEMGKYFGALFAFLLFSWFTRGHVLVTILACFVLGVYLYYQSIQLDWTFKNQV